MDVATGLVCLLLGCAPGGWIAFTLLSHSTSYSSRVALAIALSPFMVGALMAAFTAAGLDFLTTTWVTAAVSAPAAALFWLKRPQQIALSVRHLAPAACFLALAGGLVALWTTWPEEARIYNAHNMLQAEAVYQASRLPDQPEEMALAGKPLQYPWFGHIQVAAIGVLADASPFKIFPVLNILNLLAFFVLLLDVVRKFAGDRLVRASFLTTAGLLAPNLVGVVLSYWGGPSWLGDMRMTTPVHKFILFDLMTNGFSLLAAATIFSLAAIDDRRASTWAAVPICLVALALIYPLLLPPAVVVAGASLVAPLAAAWWSGRGLRLSWTTVLRGIALAVPLLVLAAHLSLLSGEASPETRIAGPRQILEGLWDGLTASAVFLPFLGLAAWRALRMREPKRLTLLIAGATIGAMVPVVVLPANNEYKFLLSAMILAIPLAAEEVMTLLDRLNSAAVEIVTGAVAAVFLLALIPHILDRHVPWPIASLGEPIDESEFYIAPVDPEHHAWVEAVRKTPKETVIVHPALSVPVTVFTQRASYGYIDLRASRPGYSVPQRGLLHTVKGYSLEVLEHRRAILEKIFRVESATDYADVDREFAALGRPVALYFSSSSGYLRSLKENQRGRVIWDNGQAVVWLLEPDVKR